MAADPNHAVFFPATWVFLLRPFSAAVRASFLAWAIGFPLLAFAGLRGLRLSSFSAATAAAAAAACGPAMTLACLPTSGWAIALFLPVLALLHRRAPRDAVAAGVVIGLAILAGEPALAVEILLLGAVFAVSARAQGGLRKAVASIVVAAAIGVLVAAPQIAGAARLLGQTVRSSGLPVASGAAFFSVRPFRAVSVLWPGLFGDLMSPDPSGFWGRAFFDAGAPYVYSLALGTIALALIPLALRERLGRRLLLLAAIASAASLGRFLPGGSALLAQPGLSFLRYPEKWLFFASMSALAACAVALDRLRRGDRPELLAAALGAAGLAGLSLAAWIVLSVFPAQAVGALTRLRVVAPELLGSSRSILSALRGDFLLVFACGFLALGAAVLGRRSPRRVSAVWSFLLLLELFARNWSSLPFAPRSFYDSPPAAAESVRSRGGRLFFDRETDVAADPLRPMRPVVWDLSFAGNNDIDRFSPRRSFFFALDLSRLAFDDPRKVSRLRLADVHAISTSDPDAASAEGVQPLSKTSAGRVLARLEGARRLRVVFAARPVPGEAQARAALFDPSFDPESEAILEGAAPSLTAEGIGRAATVESRPDLEVVEAIVSSSAVLVRSETFDPRWSAEIDGKPASVVPADFAFQAVVLPAGSHRITFRYRDSPLLWSMFISLATLFGCAVALRGLRGEGIS